MQQALAALMPPCPARNWVLGVRLQRTFIGLTFEPSHVIANMRTGQQM
jgi:hypothetical protein